eukprot:CAMPEP_0168408534 /NCGR_PEP_ID=MMETSP0228-20121227/26719_1 /TAXON_ID=133427 /ORGANISM="Protoceratium reticulatum, Strain CCCM 535 (=CCMP 1889)" /LENGTH=166 /DNA_ID=CAMNT_0008422221 /DNA_START=54 /DNA_END=554 /DNA_ORIENTATION=+
MPIHNLSITTKMVCGGCTGTVEKALQAVTGVKEVSVALDTQSARVVTVSDEVACKCPKGPDGKCCCGDNCQCMAKALVSAVEDVGFSAEVASGAFACGKAGAGPCGAPGCTCGPNCMCGTNCKCAGCPGGQGGAAVKAKAPADLLMYATIGVAVFAAGWMAAKRFG